MQISSKNYQKSLKKIHQIIDETKKKIVKSVDYQKVVMCWKIGEEIESHLKENKRADYGEKFFSELEKDTKISKRILYQMQSFHKSYPTLPSPESKLNWSHYRTLAAVKDEQTRKYLESLAVENGLGSNRLNKEVSKIKPRKKVKKSTEKLRVTRGKVGTYTLNEFGEIDLGFNIYLSATSPVVSNTSPVISNTSPVISNTSPVISNAVRNPESRDAEIPHFVRDDKGFVRDDKKWFTYLAELERVVDGDTLHVKLDLGFGVKHREILRLAQINAAEANTKEGKKATTELKKILKGNPRLIVQTKKADIYGRYVADVFFGKEETYLNQLLLDRGLAALY